MTAFAAWPGIAPVQRPSAPSAIDTVEKAAPFTEYFSAMEVTPCGSEARAETVIAWFAEGITGLCRTPAKVGPRFVANVELTAPGVPLAVGWARITVFATLL